MAGRGRGRGGGGRGRGRGGFSQQLHEEYKELVHMSVEPPPLYPVLPYRPVPLKLGTEHANRVKNLIEAEPGAVRFHFFREDLMSEFKLKLKHLFKEELKKDIDRYSDKNAEVTPTAQQNCDIDFNRIPKQLRPKPISIKRKKNAKLGARKRRQIDDSTIFHNLDELEKIGDEDVENEEENEENKKQEGEEEEEEAEPNESDIEDDDYQNDYFDNGEDFEDGSDGSGGEGAYY